MFNTFKILLSGLRSKPKKVEKVVKFQKRSKVSSNLLKIIPISMLYIIIILLYDLYLKNIIVTNKYWGWTITSIFSTFSVDVDFS
jgi:hypothetical protein